MTDMHTKAEVQPDGNMSFNLEFDPSVQLPQLDTDDMALEHLPDVQVPPPKCMWSPALTLMQPLNVFITNRSPSSQDWSLHM